MLHAVALPKGSYAVGKTLASIPWSDLNVDIRAVRRAGEEIETPELNWQIEENDIVVLIGKASKVEKAEMYLLQG